MTAWPAPVSLFCEKPLAGKTAFFQENVGTKACPSFRQAWGRRSSSTGAWSAVYTETPSKRIPSIRLAVPPVSFPFRHLGRFHGREIGVRTLRLLIKEITDQNLTEYAIIRCCWMDRILIAIGHLLGIIGDGSSAQAMTAPVTLTPHDWLLNGGEVLEDGYGIMDDSMNNRRLRGVGRSDDCASTRWTSPSKT